MSLDVCLFHFIYLLVDVSPFVPLDKGANGSLGFIPRLWGYEEFSGCRGRKYPTETFFGGDPARKTAPAVFASFCDQKEGSIPAA